MDKSDLCEYPLLEGMFFQSFLLADLHVTLLSPTTKVLMCSQDFDSPPSYFGQICELALCVGWSQLSQCCTFQKYWDFNRSKSSHDNHHHLDRIADSFVLGFSQALPCIMCGGHWTQTHQNWLTSAIGYAKNLLLSSSPRWFKNNFVYLSQEAEKWFICLD